LGSRDIANIKAPELLEVIRKVEARGALETAHRELSICGQVFRYGPIHLAPCRKAVSRFTGVEPGIESHQTVLCLGFESFSDERQARGYRDLTMAVTKRLGLGADAGGHEVKSP
jgi:hypothetical protein